MPRLLPLDGHGQGCDGHRPHVVMHHPIDDFACASSPLAAVTSIGGQAFSHTYMLGPNGDSNGYVSFKNYNALLQAYQNGEVKRLVVVGRLN
jgi:hypothetical protein